MKSSRVSSTPGARSTARPTRVELIPSAKDYRAFRAALHVGDILRGRVLEQLDERRFLIRFQGFNLVTESAVPLERGSWVRGEVVEVGEKVFLRLFPPGSSAERAAALLEELGLPVTRRNLVVLGLMARMEVPWTAENVRAVFGALQELGATAPVAELAVLARALDLPPSVSVLDTLRVMAEPQPLLGEQLEALTARIEALQELVPARVGPATAALRQAALELPVHPELLAESKAENALGELLQRAGYNWEARLLRDPQAAASFKAQLVAARSELLEQLAAMPVGTPARPLIESLQGTIETLLRHLDAAGLLARLPGLNLDHFYFHIPYWLPVPERRLLTLEVRGRKEDPTEPIDPDRLELECAVKTRRWGTLRFRLLIHNGAIRGTVQTPTLEARAAVERLLPELIRRIQAVGYSVLQLLARLPSQEPVLGTPLLSALRLDDFTFELEV